MKNFLIIFFCTFSVIVNAQITGGSKIKTTTSSGIVTITLDSIAVYDAKFLKDTLIVVSDGQSNSIGQGVPLAPKTYIFSKNVVVWDSVANTFVAPRLGYRPFTTSEHLGANNHALQFCQKYAELHPQTLVKLIQIGKSGQPISYWLTGAGVTVTNANVVLAIGTRTADVLIWDQGESDIYNTNYYADYYTLRNKWLSTTWYTNNTKHINVGLYTGAGNTLGFQDITLKKIGSDSIVTTSYVDVSNLLTVDSLHWNDSSLTVIGRERILNVFLTTPYSFFIASNSSWGLKGNSGTVVGTNFLGTTDATDLGFKTNNAERVRILANGNVGIGTSTAAATLDVNGTFNVSGASYINGLANGSNTFLQFKNNGSAMGVICSDGALGGSSLDFNNYVFGANKYFISTAGTKRFTVDGSGNVGIGTTSPAYTLDVNGTLNVSAASTFASGFAVRGVSIINGLANGSNTFLQFQNNGANIGVVGSDAAFGGNTTDINNYVFGANKYFISTAGTKRFTIDGNGNVGIGTTSPAYTLDVNGTLNVSAASTFASGFAVRGVSIINGLANGSNTFLQFQNNGANIGVIGSDAAFGGNTTDITNYVFGANKYFISTNGVKTLTIDGSQNVGIGTTTPAYKLDINAVTNSAGNPIRLQGLLQGANTDSVLSSASGVVTRNTLGNLNFTNNIYGAGNSYQSQIGKQYLSYISDTLVGTTYLNRNSVNDYGFTGFYKNGTAQTYNINYYNLLSYDISEKTQYNGIGVTTNVNKASRIAGTTFYQYSGSIGFNLYDINNNGGSVSFDSLNLKLKGANNLAYNIQSDSLIVKPLTGINFQGIKYAADYSTNYTTRSLVDKAYVDAAVFTIKAKNVAFSFPALTAGQTSFQVYTLTGVTSAYTICVSPVTFLPNGVSIAYAFGSSNQVTVAFTTGVTTIGVTNLNLNIVAIP